ncbi:hypothetical protein [Sinorhizobium prairiense]|uniref:hypothetical protein n=1 Tax=unclassified Sinorhizobium TaxID=2613772 RepID=UPI0023D802C0|nr:MULTISPECIES: hypothetical protein [unclassified Sinorhizobium]WEJ08455.1 hypothetical protein N0Q90_01820 [Sinorhizobium sp. M103]WEJ14042.1 hypothetical protein N0Q91_00895 [Sinorhizobium sp. K101]WEJ35641.1 hypothetical protein N0R80_00890 [Sinorhizobium sp. C101]
MTWLFRTVVGLGITIALAAALILYPVVHDWWYPPLQPGHLPDEAKAAGRNAASFPAADEDYFRDMDRGITLTADEIKGRNAWIVWTGGNDLFWDGMTKATFGGFDLLKIVTSDRDTRWKILGLVNEPCFDKATAPDPKYGLNLDVRRADCPADPFANAEKYPGVAVGARGKTVPVGSFYGEPSGIVGLRLFPNPDFDEAAAKHWDAKRYYSDPSYYNDKNLVRPYRVGMSCGFCHVGPSPVHPPADPERPQWPDLSSTVGAQYMWVDRLFIYSADKANFMFQLVHTYRPGAMDTSLVSTDYINNPRTMNAIYGVGQRLGLAQQLGKEKLAGGELDNKHFKDYLPDGPLSQSFAAPDTVFTPRVLKDGSDAVGALGALNRVYLNIGLFSEEWLLHFNAVVGGKPISPIKIADAQKNSSYWQATEMMTPATALFLLKAGQPDLLKDAPGGTAYLGSDQSVLEHGKTVFATTCARCHSSKMPPLPQGLDLAACNGPGYLDCFQRYWDWTKTDDFKRQMTQIVLQPDFLDGNYLSNELRIPVTLLRTNACSPLATNAIAGNIWDNFSSQSYKQLPSVGTITVRDPFNGQRRPYSMPAGGRGYTRVPSLISLWSTGPYLLNNTVGPFDERPSVEARMKVFLVSIDQMLSPEKRVKDSELAGEGVYKIDRTTSRSIITLPEGFVPEILRPLHGTLHRWFPWLVTTGGDIVIGPIPSGVPVNLIANLQPLAETNDVGQNIDHIARLVALLRGLKSSLASVPENASDEELRRHFSDQAPAMLALGKCPDFEVNRGHYFGTAAFNDVDGLSDDEKGFGPEPALSDDDKQALIEFLKTF